MSITHWNAYATVTTITVSWPPIMTSFTISLSCGVKLEKVLVVAAAEQAVVVLENIPFQARGTLMHCVYSYS